MNYVLRATLFVRLSEDPDDAVMKSILRGEYHTDRASEVIEASAVLSEAKDAIGDNAIFGAIQPHYAFLFWRDGSRRIQVSVEMTKNARFESATATVFESLKRSLRGVGVDLERAELIPYHDTHEVLLGTSGFRKEIEDADVKFGLLTSAVVAAGVAALSLAWRDQSLSLWTGNLAPISILIILLGRAAIRGLCGRVRWYPAR